MQPTLFFGFGFAARYFFYYRENACVSEVTVE